MIDSKTSPFSLVCLFHMLRILLSFSLKVHTVRTNKIVLFPLCTIGDACSLCTLSDASLCMSFRGLHHLFFLSPLSIEWYAPSVCMIFIIVFKLSTYEGCKHIKSEVAGGLHIVSVCGLMVYVMVVPWPCRSQSLVFFWKITPPGGGEELPPFEYITQMGTSSRSLRNH